MQALPIIVVALMLSGVVIFALGIAGKNAGRRRAGRAERNQQRFERSSAPEEKATDTMNRR